MNRHDRRALGIKPTETPLIQRRRFTETQMTDAINKGMAVALKAYSTTGDSMYKASLALALHDTYKFGKGRIEAVLQRMAQVLSEAKDANDLVDRCKREVGLEFEVLKLDEDKPCSR